MVATSLCCVVLVCLVVGKIAISTFWLSFLDVDAGVDDRLALLLISSSSSSSSICNGGTDDSQQAI